MTHTTPAFTIVPDHGFESAAELAKANEATTERIKSRTHPLWRGFTADHVGTGSQLSTNRVTQEKVWVVEQGPKDKPDVIHKFLTHQLSKNPK